MKYKSGLCCAIALAIYLSSSITVTTDIFQPAAVNAVSTEEKMFDAVSPVAKGSSDIVVSGTSDEVQAYFDKKGWTDGLPIIPPTDEKIQDCLRYTPYSANDVICSGYTAYTVAANAVMAGCPPEFMPMCIAFAKSLDNKDWLSELDDSHGRTPIAWINGPVSRQLAIDCEQGMISNTNNKALARFIDIALKNLAGIKTGSNDTFGTVSPYVFAEDEEACKGIGWSPYHVEQGFKMNTSTLTVSTSMAWGNNITPATPDAKKTMEVIAFDITEKDTLALGSGQEQGYRTLFITEAVASNLASLYKSKSELEDALITTAKRPLWLRTYANYWANPDSYPSKQNTIQEYYDRLVKNEKAEDTAVPDWYSHLLPDKTTIRNVSVLAKGKTEILITGDGTRNKAQTMTGGSCKTIEIELPDNWDELLDALNQKPYYNFEPISTYYLD
ncbi:MAG: hypothetical protein K2G83_06910 [Ruminococcus sp.]|nr:hypothetical protein [Ruminococcus sp.]